MSSITQQCAGLRWYALCRKFGRVTFKLAKEYVPQMFDLLPHELKLNCRREPYWLCALRNFKRDVNEGKEPNFRCEGEALVLTEQGRKTLGQYVTRGQMRTIARLRDLRK